MPNSNWLILSPQSIGGASLEDQLEARFRDALVCNQTLSSGIELTNRDIRTSVRFVFFDTGIPEWQYATEGGTAFVIAYKGRVCALTAKHVRKGFRWDQLIITDRKHGKFVAPIRAVYYPSEPEGGALGGDVVDVALIDFQSDAGADFFGDEPYIVDANTVGTSQMGDPLIVTGALKAPSLIDEKLIRPVFCALEFQDSGISSEDPVLRCAISQFDQPQFSSLTGLSGAPVFNTRTKKLAGMAVRGGLQAGHAKLHYIDIFDIMQMIDGILLGKTKVSYAKKVAVLQKEVADNSLVRNAQL